MKRTCVQCKKEFELPQSEINFYKSKNLHIPKRCKECRALNKSMKLEVPKEGVTEVRTVRKKTPVIYSVVFLVIALALFLWDKLPLNSENDNPITQEVLYESQIEQQSTEEPIGEPERIEETNAEIEKVETTVNRTSIRTFRKEEYLQEHYEKHGIDMGFDSAAEYLAAANKVLENEDVLHKIEAEDGDDVYYLEATNEFVVVSTDGYIRTYFSPEDGIDYFNRQ